MSSFNIRFTTDPALQTKYLCFVAKSIQLGKYQAGGYVVLPYAQPQNRLAVHFPDLDYSAEFWAELTSLHDYSLTQPFPNRLTQLASIALQKYKASDQTKLACEWEILAPNFLSTIQDLFPDLLAKVESVTVLITDIGTCGSFSKLQLPNGKWQFILTARSDFPVENIARTLLQVFISSTQTGYSDIGTIGWHKRNAIFDFLANQTQLTHYMTANMDTTVTPQMLMENQTYLTKLGFLPKDQISPEIIRNVLSSSELKLFDMLWNNRGVVVSFDEVATTLWGDEVDDKFSLSAIAKVVESLRAKIRSVGINYPLIHTLRKRGYLLNV